VGGALVAGVDNSVVEAGALAAGCVVAAGASVIFASVVAGAGTLLSAVVVAACAGAAAAGAFTTFGFETISTKKSFSETPQDCTVSASVKIFPEKMIF
jgi:hypothetical protein